MATDLVEANQLEAPGAEELLAAVGQVEHEAAAPSILGTDPARHDALLVALAELLALFVRRWVADYPDTPP